MLTFSERMAIFSERVVIFSERVVIFSEKVLKYSGLGFINFQKVGKVGNKKSTDKTETNF